MKRSERVQQTIEDMPEKDRQAVFDYVLNVTAAEALTKQHQYGLVLMSDYEQDARFILENRYKPIGLTTGLIEFDDMTMGLAPGELIIIAGPTSNGKTMLATNIAANIAYKGVNVLFVTLEMTHQQLASRFMFMTGDHYHEVASRVLFQKEDELNYQSVDGLIEQAVQQLKVGLVIIDHLHYFSRNIENTAEDLGRITKEFKKNAIRHMIPVILLSHIRRVEKGAEPSIDDLRGSSFIGQDSDIVIMVRKKDSVMQLKLEKNRNRFKIPIGEKRDLNFDPKTLRLSSSYQDVRRIFN